MPMHVMDAVFPFVVDSEYVYEIRLIRPTYVERSNFHTYLAVLNVIVKVVVRIKMRTAAATANTAAPMATHATVPTAYVSTARMPPAPSSFPRSFPSAN